MNDINKKIEAYRQSQSQKKAQKASFPTLEELYEKNKKSKKRASKLGFSNNKNDTKPTRLHIDHNMVTEKKSPRLKTSSPTRMLQQETGLLKFQKKGNGYRKAAKFLLLLSKDDAAEILKQFSPEEIELIAKELSTIKSVSKEESTTLLQEFKFIKGRSELPSGGIDAARNILVNAFGEKKGRELLKKSVPIDPKHKPFEFLNEIENEHLFHLLHKESDLVLSTIIPYLHPQKASFILKELEHPLRISITKRMAKLNRLDSEVMTQVELSIREKIKREAKVITEAKDGSEALANILKYMDVESEQAILEELENHSATLSQQVKEKIFTIDMIANLEDVDLQILLSDYSDRELAVILKGKSDEVDHKILSNLSANRASIVKQEKVYLGKMKRKEVDDATKQFLKLIRKKQLAGEILVRMPGEQWLD